jgi:hypothetical protein
MTALQRNAQASKCKLRSPLQKAFAAAAAAAFADLELISY